MKKRNIKALALALGFLGATQAMPVFAANPYGISYSGGEPLSVSNVSISPDLVEGLHSVIDESDSSVVFENSDNWHNIYRKTDGSCTQYAAKYFRFKKNSNIGPNSGMNYVINGKKYKANVELSKIVVDDENNVFSDDHYFSIRVADKTGAIGLNNDQSFFSDSECTSPIVDDERITIDKNVSVFVQLKMKLSQLGKDDTISSDEMFFGIFDFDGSQSNKILNPSNLLSKNNMYAKSAASLQPTDSDLRNMFVSSNGNYIYSEGNFNTPETDIYVKLTRETQKEGLDIVFGFRAGSPGSGIQFYAKEYKVTYKSDDNGTIPEDAPKEEEVISGANPTGSETIAKEDYKFVCWKADKKVMIENGDKTTTIEAGECITPDQVKQVVVNEDLVFTAIHETTKQEEPAKEEKKPDVKVPNTGDTTDEENGSTLILSIVLPISIIISGLAYYIYNRKKNHIKFN